jgi:hypothetical protein
MPKTATLKCGRLATLESCRPSADPTEVWWKATGTGEYSTLSSHWYRDQQKALDDLEAQMPLTESNVATLLGYPTGGAA